ncbi:MAG: response regulator [Candidatus Cloacimonadota bacterium]|nr:response regulator [Candidatus Cloacimonadota bacterium]
MQKLPKILLVEDNPLDVEMTLAALSENKLANKIIVAKDGEEALDYFYRRNKFADREEENPILVLLDLKMPKIDGMEVLKTIKQDDKLKNIPVVILTSSRMETDLIQSYNLGVNAYVVKPVDFDNFVEAVKDISAFWALLNEVPTE